MKEQMLPNQQRHIKNLVGETGLHGFFYKGVYYDHGVPQISKEKQVKAEEKRLARSSIVFEFKNES